MGDLTLWMGGGIHGCFFGADPCTAHFDAALNELVSRLLAILLGTDRPLSHYNCAFLLPLDLQDDRDLQGEPAREESHFLRILEERTATEDIKRHRSAVVEPGALQKNTEEPALETQARLYFLPHLQEDRMLASCAYALAGPAPKDAAARGEAERLFSLALYVDKASDTCRDLEGYVYDPKFTWNLMRGGHRLDRWVGLGTFLGFCPYANAYLGYGWFFANVIAREHVPFHYQRMLIQALFYQLTLRSFNRRITHATHLLVRDPGKDPGQYFRDLRRRFIEFTNSYWFHEVTLAIQGREIFDVQMKVLDLDREYGQIKDEMERADEYVQSVRERSMNERMAAAGWIAALLAVAALAATAFGFDAPWKHHWFWPGLILVIAASWGFYLCRHQDAQRRCKAFRQVVAVSDAIRRFYRRAPPGKDRPS